jgi:hypothetical protein
MNPFTHSTPTIRDSHDPAEVTPPAPHLVQALNKIQSAWDDLRRAGHTDGDQTHQKLRALYHEIFNEVHSLR